MTPPKSLTSDPDVIQKWLEVTHPDSEGKTLYFLLQDLVTAPFFNASVQKHLYLVGKFFGFSGAWWEKKQVPIEKLKAIGAILADAWIYRKWLEEKNPGLAKSFADFFAKTVDHPEWIQAVTALSEFHYSTNTSNSFEDSVWSGNLVDPDCLKKSDWAGNKTKLGGAVRIHRLYGQYWLRDVFEASAEKKANLLEEGLGFINFAAISGDTDFFQALGSALGTTFEQEKQASLEVIQRLPFKGQKEPKNNRPWCRRLWLSRGLWVMPPHILGFPPFNLAKSTISELTGKTCSSSKEGTANDRLFKADQLWFNEFHDSSSSITLTSEGRFALPDWATSGLSMAIVSFDIEDTN